MKFLFTLIVSFNFLTLFSQQIGFPSTESKSNQFEIGIIFSPELAYRHLGSHDTASFIPSFIKVRNKAEIPKPAYMFGVRINYPFSEKFALTTGIQFSSRGFQYKKADTYWPVLDTTGNYTGESTFAGTHKSIYRFNYFEIPLLVDYTFNKSKFSYSIGFGGLYSFLVAATYIFSETDEKGEIHRYTYKQNDSYQKTSIGLLLQTGISYALNEKSSLHVKPSFHYDLTSTFGHARVSEHLWNVGLGIGYFITL